MNSTSLAQRARTLLAAERFGVLGTQSARLPGYPFGSLVAYVDDAGGEPLFVLSRLAVHSQNLAADARAGLTVVRHADDALAAARLTLMGDVVPADDGVRAALIERHPEAAGWANFGDFAPYRLRLRDAYFVAGFGEMGWLDPEDFRQAAPDPLARVAQAIVDHMNADHADALTLYARVFGGVEADSARMTAIDQHGMELTVGSGAGPRRLRIPLSAEAHSAEQARKVLVAMLRDARARAAE